MKKLIFLISSIAVILPLSISTYADITVETPEVLSSGSVQIVGKGSGGATVVLREGNTSLCTRIIDGSGNWNCQLSTLSVGTHTIEIYENDVLRRSVVVTIPSGQTGVSVSASSLSASGGYSVSIPLGTGSYSSGYINSPWYIMHRSMFDRGFIWGDPIRYFLYGSGGTSTTTSSSTGTVSGSQTLLPKIDIHSCGDTEYEREFFPSEDMSEDSVEALVRLAHRCALPHYKRSFDGAKYATREEYLMTLLSLFNEDILLSGYFTQYGLYVPYRDIDPLETTIPGLDGMAWYAPVVERAGELGLIDTENVWKKSKSLNRIEALTLLVKMVEYKADVTIPPKSTTIFVDMDSGKAPFLIERTDDDMLNIRKAEAIEATKSFETEDKILSPRSKLTNAEMVSTLDTVVQFFTR